MLGLSQCQSATEDPGIMVTTPHLLRHLPREEVQLGQSPQQRKVPGMGTFLGSLGIDLLPLEVILEVGRVSEMNLEEAPLDQVFAVLQDPSATQRGWGYPAPIGPF